MTEALSEAPGMGDTPAMSAIEHRLLAIGLGDRQALAALYRDAGPHLYAIALRITRKAALAEEVVQDVFIAIWRNAARFDRSRGSGMAWLATIVCNRSLDLVERDRRLQPLDESAAAEIPDLAADAFAQLAAHEEGRRLHACLEDLGEQPRRAVLLAFFDGATHEEVAVRMGSPLGTVKSWVRRALLRLKECLGHG